MKQKQAQTDDLACLARYTAWHTALYSRTKKMPKLNSVVKSSQTEPLSREGRINAFRAAFGSNIVVKEKRGS